MFVCLCVCLFVYLLVSLVVEHWQEREIAQCWQLTYQTCSSGAAFDPYQLVTGVFSYLKINIFNDNVAVNKIC